jgi:hypothetical protein
MMVLLDPCSSQAGQCGDSGWWLQLQLPLVVVSSTRPKPKLTNNSAFEASAGDTLCV